MPLSIDKKCCVPNCGKTRLDGTILHSFPNPDKDPDRFRTWLYAIGGDILALDNKTIFKYRRVCHDHFQPRFYTASKMLCCNATPTVNVPGFRVAKRKPLQEITNVISTSENLPESDERNLLNVPSTSSGLQNYRVIDTSKKAPKRADNTMKRMKKEIPPPVSEDSVKRSQRQTEITALKLQIKKIQKSKNRYAEKFKKALKLTENPSFLKATQSFTPAAMILLMMQLNMSNKGKFGRRYSKEEKILSLAFYKMGPRAYRWFRNILVLPSPVTLSRMISCAALKPGINKSIFRNLKKRALRMSESEKLCVLLFDEMALTPHFDYNKKKDLIRGFVDNGTNSKIEIADHVLVFMIRGIQKNYKQPLAYTFCKGSTPKMDLKNMIKVVIAELQLAGMRVIATVCDQGTSNVSAIKELVNDTKILYLKNGQEIKQNIFQINSEEIVPLFDVPHLLKGIRNNMIIKNIICIIDNKLCRGKWDHLVTLYEENPAFNGLRFLPKLTEHHVIPNKIKKMKVKCATQAFSASVAMCLGYFADKKIIPEECKETAIIIQFLDQLFDSLNGSYGNAMKKSGKPLLGPVAKSSCHHKFWSEAKKILNSMKFINSQGKISSIPSIKNWIWTIENVEYMKEKLLKDHNLVSFWMRHFNQDPLENFFGSIRSHGVRNTNPTCATFETAFAAVLINNLSSHSKGSNCEADSSKIMLLNSLKNIFFHPQSTSNNDPLEIDYSDLFNDHILVTLETKKGNQKMFDILKYVTGYIIKKARAKIFKNCEICLQNLISKEKKEFEFTIRKERLLGKSLLTYPSMEAIQMFSNIQDVVLYVIRKKSNNYDIKTYIKTIIYVQCNFNYLKCLQHATQLSKYIIDTSCNLFLYSWCKNTNRILSGIRKDYDEEDVVQHLCIQYFNKRKK